MAIDAPLNILLLDPFHDGSHASWSKGVVQHSKHHVQLETLPGRHWKWRMHGAALTFAERVQAMSELPDLVVATDMLDLSTFQSLTRNKLGAVPMVLYMHENQLTYPWSEDDPDPALERDNHYAFINFTSCLAADEIWFNSAYHRQAFIAALGPFLQKFPAPKHHHSVASIEAKSKVKPLGFNFKALDALKGAEARDPQLILWNHRWEYDKNPEAFFNSLFRIAEQGVPFRLAVLGQHYQRVPIIFEEARERLADQIIQWGPVEDADQYRRWLHRAAILPVTSRQDFFGISAVEAMYAGVHPILPNRLAFPEHLPEGQAARYLYQTEAELDQMILRALQCETLIQSPLPAFLTRYNWSAVAEDYDCSWAELVG